MAKKVKIFGKIFRIFSNFSEIKNAWAAILGVEKEGKHAHLPQFFGAKILQKNDFFADFLENFCRFWDKKSTKNGIYNRYFCVLYYEKKHGGGKKNCRRRKECACFPSATILIDDVSLSGILLRKFFWKNACDFRNPSKTADVNAKSIRNSVPCINVCCLHALNRKHK